MRFLLSLVLGAMLALGVLEACLSVLPVNSGLRMVSTSAAEPYSRYLPRQAFVYSHGWNLLNARHGTTNNLGFINAADFDRPPSKVLIIGDSFIESFMHNYPDTLQGHLESTLGKGIDTVATSGNGLADTLQLLRKFVPMMRPSAVVIFVKTWDPSVIAAAPLPGYSGFFNEGKNVTVHHVPYRESAVKKWVTKSALIRYLYYNLKLSEWLSQALKFGAPVGRSIDKDVLADEAAKKLQFTRYYLSEVNAIKKVYGLQVTFLLDGDRRSFHPSQKDKTQVSNIEDHSFFIRLANEAGFDLVDMQPIFKRHWLAHREEFDYLPADGHWNAVAHKLAADALVPSLLSLVHGDLSGRQQMKN